MRIKHLVAIASLLGVAAAEVSAVPPCFMTEVGRDPEPLSKPAVTLLLIELGLGPEALAASGVTSGSVAALVAAARSEVQSHADDIRGAEARVVAAIAATKVHGTDHQAAVTELEAARTAQATLKNEIGEAILENLSSQQRDRVRKIRANRHRGVPVQYLLTERTDADWTRLRQSIAAVRDATAKNREAGTAVRAIIADADADTETISAVLALSQNLATVREAWSGAMSQD